MSTREFDPLRLDVAVFAERAGVLEGTWALTELARVAESAAPDGAMSAGDEVRWSAQGEARPVRGGAPEIRLHLRAEARVPLECQRCLRPVMVPLRVEREFLFVPGEDAAAALDADSEEDVLALTRALDLRELIEDELLLAMPIVPRHDVCPEPLPAPAPDPAAGEAPPHPFAALAALRRGKPN